MDRTGPAGGRARETGREGEGEGGKEGRRRHAAWPHARQGPRPAQTERSGKGIVSRLVIFGMEQAGRQAGTL